MKRRRGIAGWITLVLFWGWNGLMLYAMVVGAEFSAQNFRLWQLQAMEALDAGENLRTVLSIVGPRRLRRPDGSVIPNPQADLLMNYIVMYSAMPAARRGAERARIEAEFSAFNPTPIMGIGFTMILFIWALGAVAFGLLAHFTRGRREFVEMEDA